VIRLLFYQHYSRFSLFLYFRYTKNKLSMAEETLAYIPASRGFYDLPLGRFLPLLPKNVISAWVAEHTQSGSLILDPLGAHPLLSIEAAQAGMRLLVARNNPILWLMLESMARAPTREQLWKPLTKLLISRRGSQTIEDHLRSIYATPCAGCGQMIQPQGFIWEQDLIQPVSRVYLCPFCGDEGEKEISETDLQKLNDLGSLGLHRARAFQRVLQGGDYEQATIESALDCYLPRALYVCMTLVNRMEQLELDKDDRQLLQAILLLVFDDASSLWHWPARDQSIFQLNVPSRFMEKNLWLSLDKAPEQWSAFQQKVPISYWPNLPGKSGGICFYQRRLAEKEDLFKEEQPAAIVSVFPRPNQAFWTLSALWSGWLWGRKAVTPMRSALGRRRYDWRWFAQALEAALKDLSALIQPGTPMFGLLSQAAPNHLLGLLAGANASGFQLQGQAASQSEEIIQCAWLSGQAVHSPGPLALRPIIQRFMETRGEPVKFQPILNDCLAQIASQGKLPTDIANLEETYFSQIQQQVSDVLRDDYFMQSFQSGPASGSSYWLVNSRAAQPPLSERLEAALLETLRQKPLIPIDELERTVFRKLGGQNTPECENLRLCLESYADEEPDAAGVYRLKSPENQAAREKDMAELCDILETCGRKFGLAVKRDANTIAWEAENGDCRYLYFLLADTGFSKYVLDASLPASANKVLVLPGSRARWLIFRLRQDPRLEAALEGKWIILKYRHLRWLAAREWANLDLWDELLNDDPLQWDASPQMQML